jgi:protein gp37
VAENSKIEWTDQTFNPWIGCQHVSPGCDHCYVETMMDLRYGRVQWGPHGERQRTSEANWKLPLRWWSFRRFGSSSAFDKALGVI